MPINRISLAVALLLTSWASAEEAKVLTAVCSTTQIADFTRNVVGDDWRVICLLAPGQDPHLYEPTLKDAEQVSTADVCLANGWHLEGKGWFERLARDGGRQVVHCVQGVKPLSITGSDETARDPHAWFTPANAMVYVRNILQAVQRADPDRREVYQARAALYASQLRSLDAWIRLRVNEIPTERRVLVTSHDAFQYFCRGYGFRSASPLSWSTEELGGLTPKRRQQSVQSIRDHGVPAVFMETSVNPKVIREIAKEAGVRLGGRLYSDSMGSSGSAGESYIGMMRENVLTITNGLRTTRPGTKAPRVTNEGN